MVSMPFVSLHCSYHLGVDCVWMETEAEVSNSHIFWSPCNMAIEKYWKVWCLERVPLCLVHKVMICVYVKSSYIFLL